VPSGALGINGDFEVEDLFGGKTFTWHEEWNYVELDPGILNAHIFKIKSKK
jgi:starch synthase (maltosyl-transferring)